MGRIGKVMGLVVVLIGVVGAYAQSTQPVVGASTQPGGVASTQPAEGRGFNSTVELEVFVQKQPNGEWDAVGRTPAAAPLVIPACHAWWVVLRGGTTVAQVAQEVRAKSLPGILLGPEAGDDEVAQLKELTSLQTLYLGGTKVTDAGLAHLKGLKGLQMLELGNTQVTDAGLVHLKQLTSLLALYLSETRVTDAGLAHLTEFKSLRTLDLWRTQVTDGGLVNLKELKGLQALYLGDTPVTGAGADELRKSLPGCKIVAREPAGH